MVLKTGCDHGASLTGRVRSHSRLFPLPRSGCWATPGHVCSQPKRHATYAKEKTPHIWLYSTPRNALVFSRRFILSDVWDNLRRCSYSRQCVSNCAQEISYLLEIMFKNMTTKLDSLLNIYSFCKVSFSLFPLKGWRENCRPVKLKQGELTFLYF